MAKVVFRLSGERWRYDVTVADLVALTAVLLLLFAYLWILRSARRRETRFSSGAQHAIAFARVEAERLQSPTIEPVHLLLGLLHVPVPAILKLLPPDSHQAIRDEVKDHVGGGAIVDLLSIQTSGLAIDLEQAKRPGHTGWTTGTLSNTFSSDLLRDFSLSTTHDLFQGTVGTAGSRFKPFLTSVSARFSLGPSFLQFLGSLFGFGSAEPPPPAAARRDSARAADSIQVPVIPNYAFQRGPLQNQPGATDRILPRGAANSFRASLAFDLQRTRPVPGQISPTTRSTLSGGASFSPTRDWSVSWQTLYDFTAGKFGSHVLTLSRNMHDWHATFSFVQSPNGNVVFNFNITLIDQPEIKFDYDQRNLPSTPY